MSSISKHMNRILLFAIMFMITFTNAQNTVYYNFENCTISTTHEKLHTFNLFGNGNSGCLADWEVVNGTPSIYNSNDGYGSAFEGNQFVLLGVDNTQIGEGAALKFNFQSGKQYQITLARKNATSNKLVNIDYVLLQSAIPYVYNYGVGASAIPSIPTGALNVLSESSVTSGSWQTINITTPVLTTNFTRFWIRPSFTNYNQGQVLSLFDSLIIKELVMEPASYCMSFDTPTVTDKQHTFNTYGNGNPGFLEDWEVTNGTPSIYNSNDGFGAAYDGNQFVLLGVDNTVIGEGAALLYPFKVGKQYQITMARRNATAGKLLNIDYVLLQNKINYTYNTSVGASPIPAIPSSGSLVIQSEQGLSSGPWQVINITTPVLTSAYNRFWIRPSFTNFNQGQVLMLFDSLCITEISDPVGIADYYEKPFLIYPNPTTGTINIELPHSSIIKSVKVYNYAGALVKESDEVNRQSVQLSISELNAGIYLLDVLDTAGNRSVQRVLLQR